MINILRNALFLTIATIATIVVFSFCPSKKGESNLKIDLNSFYSQFSWDTSFFKIKVIDSSTQKLIPFVKIIFYKDSGVVNDITDKNGELTIKCEDLSPRATFSAIGYKSKVYTLTPNKVNLLPLMSENNFLSAVSVASQVGKNANSIIKKVGKKFVKNYGDISFEQTYERESFGSNYDSLKINTHNLYKTRYDKEEQSFLYRPLIKSDTITNDPIFLSRIGVPKLLDGSIFGFDFVRELNVTDEKNRLNYEFNLVSKYKDKNEGTIYLIHFKPKQSNYHVFAQKYGNNSYGYFNGELLISGKDFAILNIKFTYQRNVDGEGALLKQEYQGRGWKSFKFGKIVPNSEVYTTEYNYEKDTKNGKYFVKNGTANCYEDGTQIETGQYMQLHYQINLNSLKIDY